MASERLKDCYCHNCKKHYHHLGIMMHRAMHRSRGEKVKITFSMGDTYEYDFSKRINVS